MWEAGKSVSSVIISDFMNRKKITEKQCIEMGGHCFESTNQVLTSNPPQFPEICKHCYKKRIGQEQPRMKYYYPE